MFTEELIHCASVAMATLFAMATLRKRGDETWISPVNEVVNFSTRVTVVICSGGHEREHHGETAVTDGATE